MKITSMELETVCGITSKLPENEKPEFAFAGRSNVGKSSLINALLNRKSFARTSQQPGKTQTINFYKISDRFYFVDLPGYGYAKISQEMRVKWGHMIEKYLSTSKQLKNIFLLVDSRHEPTADDVTMAEWVRSKGFKLTVIATKSDKLGRMQLQKQLAVIKSRLKLGSDVPVIAFSALTKQGVDEIMKLVDAYIGEEQICPQKQ